MSNHFHLLIHIPKTPKLNDEELVDRIASVGWDRIREISEKPIHLVLKEFEYGHLAGPAKKGLPLDEEKAQKGRQKTFERFEQAIPDGIPSSLVLPDVPLDPGDTVSVEGVDKNRFSPDKKYKLLSRGKAVIHE